jgi:drug/metabolite transporter (DMT)-like permease
VCQLGTLGSAIAFAFQIIYISKSAPKYDYIVISTYQNFIGGLLSLITMLIFEGFKIDFTLNTWFVLLYMGIIVSIIAYTLQIKAQGALTAVQASVICSLEAVFASLSAIIFYEERLKILTVIGMFLIFISIVLPEVIAYRIKKIHHKNMV